MVRRASREISWGSRAPRLGSVIPAKKEVYCNNTERVALQRRLPEDDAWCVPHNRCLLMFSPSAAA